MSKRVLSLVLAFAMILGTFSFVAAESLTDIAGHWGEERIQYLYDKGVVSGHGGSGEGTFAPEDKITRAEFATMVNKALGFTEAGEVEFDDVAEDAWYYEQVALGVKAGFISGYDNGTFAPGADITRQEAASMISRAYGLEELEEIEEPFVDADKIASWAVGFVNAVKEAGFIVGDPDGSFRPTDDITRAEAASITYGVVVALEEAAEELAVVEVSASSANSFKVEFNKAVADTDDVEFAVARGSVTTDVTVKWSEDNTVATLTASSNLPEATFTVTVNVADEVLAEVEVEIEKEKVEKVVFDSDMIVRVNDHQGIVGFRVENQYGDDITNTGLGRVTFTSSTNDGVKVDRRAGILTFTHGDETSFNNQLKDLPSVVLTARESTGSFVQTNTFEISESVGAIESVKIKGIVDEDWKPVEEFIADAAETYYLDFEAIDANGNPITYYDALDATLYGQNILTITSSNIGAATITRDRHPENQSRMVFRIDITEVNYDTPVTFILNAPFAGSNDSYTANLLRSARLETFTMFAPAETATVGKGVEIPFEALDQNGKEITRHTRISNRVQLSDTANVEFVKQSDGTTKLIATYDAKGLKYITATVSGSTTGSFSQIAIDVQEVSDSENIEALAHSLAYTEGAKWSRRVNHFTVRDQYNNKINLRNDPRMTAYSIEVATSNANIVAVNGTDAATIAGEAAVEFTGGNQFGTATITYTLLKNGVEVDKTSALVRNIDPDSIVDVEISEADAIYMLANYEGTLPVEWTTGSGELVLTGLTSGGLKVRLNDGWRNESTVTDSKFTVTPNRRVKADGDFGTANSATATVTAYANIPGQGVMSDSTTVTAVSTAPQVESIDVGFENVPLRTGVISVRNNVVTIGAQDFVDYFAGNNILDNDIMSFTVETQYGEYKHNEIIVNTSGANVAIDNNGIVDVTGSIANGSSFEVTVTAANNQSTTVRFVFTGNYSGEVKTDDDEEVVAGVATDVAEILADFPEVITAENVDAAQDAIDEALVAYNKLNEDQKLLDSAKTIKADIDAAQAAINDYEGVITAEVVLVNDLFGIKTYDITLNGADINDVTDVLVNDESVMDDIVEIDGALAFNLLSGELESVVVVIDGEQIPATIQ